MQKRSGVLLSFYSCVLLLFCRGYSLLVVGQEVEVVVSAANGDRLKTHSPVRFSSDPTRSADNFRVDEGTTFQTIAGFGASLLESGMVCINSLPADQQERLFETVFDPVRGAGFSAMKSSIAGTDASAAGPWYTYDDVADDIELKHFSIDRDLGTNGALTYIQRARKYGKFILQAPMDFPPDWMLLDVETNQDVNPQYYDVLAGYYLRYLQEYKKHGVEIDYLCLFNEPGIYTQIRYNEIRDLLRDHVAPLLDRSGLKTRLMFSEAPTRQQARERYPQVLDDRAARSCISVLAYHGYDHGHFEEVAQLHARYPELPVWMTEVCHAYVAGFSKDSKLPRADFEDGAFWGQEIFGDLEAGASAWIYWNMVLDQNGGPWLVSPIHHNPDPNVQQPLIIINRKTKEVTYTGGFYYLAHFSKFVRPGAVRLGVKGKVAGVDCLAFKTPEHKHVVQLLNNLKETKRVWVRAENKTFSAEMPALSIVTCRW